MKKVLIGNWLFFKKSQKILIINWVFELNLKLSFFATI